MKKILAVLSVACLAAVQTAHAQAKPYYTQYILNNYILNPAITGIENYTDVKLSYRNQWAGITGAPLTTYLSIHGPNGISARVLTPSRCPDKTLQAPRPGMNTQCRARTMA